MGKFIKSFEELNESKDGLFRDGDIVTLKNAVGDIAAGNTGTVVYIHGDETYQVEFVIDGKNSVETVDGANLSK